MRDTSVEGMLDRGIGYSFIGVASGETECEGSWEAQKNFTKSTIFMPI